MLYCLLRVSGELPASVEQVDNIYTFNLMLSIDEGDDPARLAHVTLTDFLARLARRTIVNGRGEERKGWVYDATQAPDQATTSPNARRYALIVDQFEEIITASPERWREREAFFRQLDQAMMGDPNLWVVFTLREDYVASLDPYAPLLTDRLRARFYMERMGVDAALDAITKPAAQADHPFAEGVAEALVDNLRRIKVVGQAEGQLGQYVEPVQLQVVCYQLWEKAITTGASATSVITMDDLQQFGDVDKALADFYEQAIRAVLALPEVHITESQLRTWFDEQLITDANTRSTVYRGATETGGMSNRVVDVLQRLFLLRTELRVGSMWVELMHDRFVEPIQRANVNWRNRPQMMPTAGKLLSEVDPELYATWRKHIEQGFQNNQVMFEKVLRGFMNPYWTTVWTYRILFGIGIIILVVALLAPLTGQGFLSAVILGSLSIVFFIAYFLTRPLQALEENLQFITWLGIIYNSYWTRLAYINAQETVQQDLEKATNDTIVQLEKLMDKHAERNNERVA
ncbi:MAG: hypothetical protein R3E79_60660 [Caldilineaceae bacterium]